MCTIAYIVSLSSSRIHFVSQLIALSAPLKTICFGVLFIKRERERERLREREQHQNGTRVDETVAGDCFPLARRRLLVRSVRLSRGTRFRVYEVSPTKRTLTTFRKRKGNEGGDDENNEKTFSRRRR